MRSHKLFYPCSRLHIPYKISFMMIKVFGIYLALPWCRPNFVVNDDGDTDWNGSNILLRDYVNKFRKPTNTSFESLITNLTYFRENITQLLYRPKCCNHSIFQIKHTDSKLFPSPVKLLAPWVPQVWTTKNALLTNICWLAGVTLQNYKQ